MKCSQQQFDARIVTGREEKFILKEKISKQLQNACCKQNAR